MYIEILSYELFNHKQNRGLREFIDGTWIVDIQDITPFVIEQSSRTTGKPLEELLVPSERVYHPSDPTIATRIRLSDDYDTNATAEIADD